MQIDIDDKSIYADGYIPNSKEKSVLFYKNKDDLDYIPPIKIVADALSDFGRKVLQVERSATWNWQLTFRESEEKHDKTADT